MGINRVRMYYDGPVRPSGMTLEELDRFIEIEKQKSEELTDWETE